MNFFSGAQEELRGDETAGTQADRAVLAKPAPQAISGRRVRCGGDPGRPLTLGAGLGACPLPRLQDQVQQEEGGRAWGRHGDSSAPRGLCGRQWRGSAGTGRCPRASGSERHRWRVGRCAAVGGALTAWLRWPQPALYGPEAQGKGGRRGEDRVGAAPLARIPHLPGRAGAAGTGSGGHRGSRDQTELE